MKKRKVFEPIELVHKRFLLPLGICQLVARERRIPEFELFVYLKAISHGEILITDKVIKSASHVLACHPRTVKRNLAKLKVRNWIGKYKRGVSILRSFSQLYRIEQVPYRRTGAEFSTTDFHKLQALVVSVGIGYLSRSIAAKDKRRAFSSGLKKASPSHKAKPLLNFVKLACTYIAVNLDVSPSTASIWKRIGEEAGFLSIRSNLIRLNIDNRMEYARQDLGDAHKIIFKHGRCYRQETDLIATSLRFKSRLGATNERYKSGHLANHNKSIEAEESPLIKHAKLLRRMNKQ